MALCMMLLLSLMLMHVAAAAAHVAAASCFMKLISYIVLYLLLMFAVAHCRRQIILQLQAWVYLGIQKLLQLGGIILC